MTWNLPKQLSVVAFSYLYWTNRTLGRTAECMTELFLILLETTIRRGGASGSDSVTVTEELRLMVFLISRRCSPSLTETLDAWRPTAASSPSQSVPTTCSLLTFRKSTFAVAAFPRCGLPSASLLKLLAVSESAITRLHHRKTTFAHRCQFWPIHHLRVTFKHAAYLDVNIQIKIIYYVLNNFHNVTSPLSSLS